MAEEVVVGAFQFRIKGHRAVGGHAMLGKPAPIYLAIEEALAIREPLPATTRKRSPKDGEDSSEHGDSDLQGATDCSDISAPEGVIDTDKESCGEVFEESGESCQDGGDEDAGGDSGEGEEDGKAGVAVPKAPPRKALWATDYFYIPDNTHKADGTAKMIMIDAWKLHPPPLGMGLRPQRSKTITCSHYGWDRIKAPQRAFLLLRAWMLWRFAHGGFATAAAAEKGRHRQYLEDCASLLREITAQGCADGLLGNASANAELKKYVPELVATLLKGVQGAVEGICPTGLGVGGRWEAACSRRQ